MWLNKKVEGLWSFWLFEKNSEQKDLEWDQSSDKRQLQGKVSARPFSCYPLTLFQSAVEIHEFHEKVLAFRSPEGLLTRNKLFLRCKEN